MTDEYPRLDPDEIQYGYGRSRSDWGEGGKGTPSQEARFHGEGIFAQFSEFIEQNMPGEAINKLADIFSDFNRFQKGTESIAELLSKTREGQVALKTLEAYKTYLKKHKKINLPIDFNTKGNAGDLQTIASILAELRR